MTLLDAKRILEAALLCAQEPLTLSAMGALWHAARPDQEVLAILAELQSDWSERGLELLEVATGWRFQSCMQMREYLDRMHPEKPPRYARASLETLAIIAYRQPVTRGDIEAIRGVAINSSSIKQLEERGWIEVVGRRETVGRPELFATTQHFLDDLGLGALDQLPLLELADAANLPAVASLAQRDPVESVLLPDLLTPAQPPLDTLAQS